jgi:Tol biopolymer transport system component
VLDGMTGSLRPVVTPGMTPGTPAFSPDGRWLAFSATSTNPAAQAATVWLARR